MEEAGISVLSIERGAGGRDYLLGFWVASSTGSVWVRIELWECFGTRILTQCPVRPQSSPIVQFDTKPTQTQRATSKWPIWNCFYDYNRSDLSAAVIGAFSGRGQYESP